MPKPPEPKTRKTGKAAKPDEPVMIATETQNPVAPMHDLLAQKLRAYYDQVASEPVPDRFAALLQELEAKSARKKSPR